MARQLLTAAVAPGRYPATPTAISWKAAIVSDMEKVALTGQELLIAWNTSPSTPRTVTVTSVADTPQGRTGNITAESIAAGAYHMFGVFANDGWRQTDGMLYFNASDPDIFWAVIQGI